MPPRRVVDRSGGGINAAAVSYTVSWVVAAIAARIWWMRLSAGMGDQRATRDQVREALRYGLPRAPSALFAQALFWADLFVLGHYIRGQKLDAYAAAGRVSQVLLLFVISTSLIFSPFAAELHARGDTARLDHLFKDATRWAVAATLPILIILFVAADDVLRVFGSGLQVGSTPLRIMLVGQAVNVATGSVAAVLIIVGRTGLDLVDNLVANILLVGIALLLVSRYGPTGAAIASAVAIAGVNLLRVAQVNSRTSRSSRSPARSCRSWCRPWRASRSRWLVHWLTGDLMWWVIASRDRRFWHDRLRTLDRAGPPGKRADGHQAATARRRPRRPVVSATTILDLWST